MHCLSIHPILVAFKIFSLLLALRNSVMLCLGMVSFTSIVLGFHWISYISEFIIFLVWKDFRYYFLSHFCTILPLFSLFRISFTWVSSRMKLSYSSLIIVLILFSFCVLFCIVSIAMPISNSIEEIHKKLEYKVLFLWIGLSLYISK